MADDTVDYPPARKDGRPLFFDILPGSQCPCVMCERMGIKTLYGYTKSFINDRANSPLKDGAVYMVCYGHLPDNAVIYNPHEPGDLCRNKAGTLIWSEENPHVQLAQSSLLRLQ